MPLEHQDTRASNSIPMEPSAVRLYLRAWVQQGACPRHWPQGWLPHVSRCQRPHCTCGAPWLLQQALLRAPAAPILSACHMTSGKFYAVGCLSSHWKMPLFRIGGHPIITGASILKAQSFSRAPWRNSCSKGEQLERQRSVRPAAGGWWQAGIGTRHNLVTLGCKLPARIL